MDDATKTIPRVFELSTAFDWRSPSYWYCSFMEIETSYYRKGDKRVTNVNAHSLPIPKRVNPLPGSTCIPNPKNACHMNGLGASQPKKIQ